MNRFAIILAGIAGSLLVGFSAPALAADDTTPVTTFVVPDPTLDGCGLGNGVLFVGDGPGVAWTVKGEPYTFTPQGRTLWLPTGFDGTITATSTVPGVELYERTTERRGTSLSWHQIVTPISDYCSRIADLASQRSASDARISTLESENARLVRIAERRQATIKKLRAKLAQVR